MSNHLAIQIRDAVLALVTGLPTTGSNAFKTPLYPLARNALPAVVVELGQERLTSRTVLGTASRKYERLRDVDVVGYARDETDLDGALAQIGKEVEEVITLTAVGPWKTITLAAIVPQLDVSGEQPVGLLRMRFQTEYYTREGVPDVAI